jgi:hypothetical protein
MDMKKRSLKKLKRTKKVVINFIYDLLLGGKEYDTEIEKAPPLPLASILGTVISTMLILALIFSFIEISSLSSDIGDLRKEMVNLTTREGKLHDDLNHKYPHAELMEAIENAGFTPDGGQTVVLSSEEMSENTEK